MAKKLLISDYDGTLFSDLKNLELNKLAINKFKKQGNIFAISTGRSYKSIKEQIDVHDIPYDYVMCNSGLTLYDNKGNLIKSFAMDKSDIITSVLVARDETCVKNIIFYNESGRVEIKPNLSDICEHRIIEIQLQKKMLGSLKSYLKCIKEAIPDLTYEKYGNHYFIKGPYSKKTCIDYLLSTLDDDISKDDVITVGDSHNDLDMLKEFNGYKMLYSYPCMYFKGLKTTREVHTLIKKISK